MSTPFLSEIKIVSFNFAPKGWALCNGQLLPINQNQALFSLLGTTYGGDGRVNFALPNLQGRIPNHVGDGFTLGEVGGEQSVTLIQTEMPVHSHGALGASGTGQNSPVGNAWASGLKTGPSVYTPSGTQNNDVAMNPLALAISGGSQPHNNMMPFLTLNFCIALQGIFPPRT